MVVILIFQSSPSPSHNLCKWNSSRTTQWSFGWPQQWHYISMSLLYLCHYLLISQILHNTQSISYGVMNTERYDEIFLIWEVLYVRLTLILSFMHIVMNVTLHWTFPLLACTKWEKKLHTNKITTLGSLFSLYWTNFIQIDHIFWYGYRLIFKNQAYFWAEGPLNFKIWLILIWVPLKISWIN